MGYNNNSQGAIVYNLTDTNNLIILLRNYLTILGILDTPLDSRFSTIKNFEIWSLQ